MAEYTFTGKTILAGDGEHFKRAFIEAGDSAAVWSRSATGITVDTTLSEVNAEAAVDDAIAHTADEFPSACKVVAYTLVESDDGKAIVCAGITKALPITLPTLRPHQSGWSVTLVNEDTTYDITISGLSGSLSISPLQLKTLVWSGTKWLDGSTSYAI